jgi:membrane protease YdiL (CAAX protease family)
MKLERIRQTKSKLAIFALIGFVYFLQFYGIWQLPFMDTDLPRPWNVYFARSVQTIISIFFIWLVAPKVFERFRFKFRPKTLRIGIIFTIFASAPNIYYFGVDFKDAWDLLSGIVFAMAIGVDEEIYDRGFVFGSLERFGREFALIFSAILFGLAHFPNYLYGDESFNYVIGHMIDAASFGYLMAALMLYTGNIWFPILVHGLIDLPWVMMPRVERTEAVTGSTDWGSVIFYSSTCIIVSRVMLYFMQENPRLHPKIEKTARYLGLIK